MIEGQLEGLEKHKLTEEGIIETHRENNKTKVLSDSNNSDDDFHQEVKQFDISELQEVKNFSMGLFGKRRTGKTVLLKYILSKIYKFYDECHIFSGTSRVQQEIYGFTDPEYVYDGYDEAKLDDIINDSQTKIKQLLRDKPSKVSESDFKKNQVPYKLIILDDVISDKTLRYSKLLNDIFILGRHLNIAVIFLSQTVTGIPKSMRANLDLAGAFHLNNIKDSSFFIEQYFSDNGTKFGRELMNRVTQKNYNCIMVKNYVTSQDIYDRVFQITAEVDTPVFKIGKTSKSIVDEINTSTMGKALVKHLKPKIKSIKINFIQEDFQ